MEKRPRCVLLKFPGTNADVETARALETVGFATETVPITKFTEETLGEVRLVVLSGGFSYGDYVMSGRFASLITRQKVDDALVRFRDEGGYLLGICNGFQILTQLGLLPEGSLVDNVSGRFQCRWVTLEKQSTDSPFLTNLPDTFEFPIAHAEGRFVTGTPEEADQYRTKGRAALTYRDEVNGSFGDIAGLQDESGRVLGLMPHPERFVFREDHYDPDWKGPGENQKWGSGYYLFQSVFEAITAE